MTASFLARLTDSIADVWTDRRRRTGLILTGSGMVLMLIAAALATTMALRIDKATKWVEHSYQVRSLAAETVTSIQGVALALRDRVVSPSTVPPRAYLDARSLLLDDLSRIRSLIADNDEQFLRLDEIDESVRAYLSVLDGAAATSNEDALSVVGLLVRGQGKALSDHILQLVRAFDDSERSLLESRQSRTNQLEALLLGLTLLSLVFATIVSVAVVRTSWSYIQDLRAQSAELRAEAASRREAEAMLLQTQKLETIGQLTAGIAHDFNNLLTVVIGNLDTVKRRLTQAGAIDPDRLIRPVDTAVEGARRAAQLTQKLLSFARQQPLAPVQLDLNRAVASMSDVLARTVGEGVRMETVLAAGLWPAFADPAHVDNAIVNLVVNARDAMPEGGRIIIETANASLDEHYVGRFGDVAPGQYVLLSVSDTGEGIPRDILPRVFEPFFTTKDVGKGTGLGLAMIHGFVKQSKGHIRIYSEPGQGTTVRIYLPRMTGAVTVAAAPGAKEPADAPAPNAEPGEVVLLVEDDEGVRDFARTALESLGYTVLAGRDGAEGLTLLRTAGRVDVLFTDVVLPGGVNGRTLADEALKLRPRLPVLFTTGYTRNAIIHDGRLDPDVRLISKPYTQNMLAWSLRRILEDSAQSV